MTRNRLAFLIGLLLAFGWAQSVKAQRAKDICESGTCAEAWMFDVTYAAGASAGYGALRLVGLRPTLAAATAASVNVVLHLGGWIKGDYRPSKDWLFDFTTRGAPALVLAVCETKGKRWCLASIGATVASYLAFAPHASP